MLVQLVKSEASGGGLGQGGTSSGPAMHSAFRYQNQNHRYHRGGRFSNTAFGHGKGVPEERTFTKCCLE